MTTLEEAWDDRRLGIALMNRLGAFGRGGRVDARVAAAMFEVAPDTVRRWIRQGVPRGRVAQLRELLMPPAAVLEQERRDLANAREALWDISGRGVPVAEEWRKNGWLKPHALAIVSFGNRQLCTARLGLVGGARTMARLQGDGGEIVEIEEFRNRFAAVVARLELLEDLGPWRVSLPNGALKRGHTQAWLAAAPRPTLEELRRHPKVKIPVTKPRRRKTDE